MRETPGRSVTVVGAGTMGRGIVQVSLAAGFQVTVSDVSQQALDDCRTAVRRGLARQAGEPEASRLLQSLTTCSVLEDAVSGADVVIEAATEHQPVKLDIFRRLGCAAPPDALLASNTSTMSITELAAAANDSARVLGMHFFNPVHRMPLVEIVAGDLTDEQSLEAARQFAAAIGKEPIVVRDVPGFVTSRLGLLLGNAAMRLVEEGVATAADVDKAMRLGYGHPMGPLELADLVGLDARLNNLRSMLSRSSDQAYAPPDILLELVAAGRLGNKSGSGFYDHPAGRT